MGILHIPHPRKWNHKHIILATLTGTQLAITMAAIISIVLSPGHISFSIEKTASRRAVEEDTKYYSFTLVANNTSPHMAAVYGALSAEIWYSETAWVPAVVNGSSLPEDRTARWKPAYINTLAEYWQSEQTSVPPPPANPGAGQSPPAGTDETDWSKCTVLVTATVRFKYRWISTRSYNVLANCSPVNFNGTGGSVPCKLGDFPARCYGI